MLHHDSSFLFRLYHFYFCCLWFLLLANGGGVRSDVSWNNKTKLCRSINICLCLETWFFFSSNFLLSWIYLDILRLVWLSIHSLRHLRFRLFKYFLHLHVLISVRVFIEYFFSYVFSKDLTGMKINFTRGSYAFWYVPPLLLLVLWIIVGSMNYFLQICFWNTESWEKRKSITIQLPAGRMPVGDTRVQFHSDQVRMLVCHETQLAVYDASKMERIRQVKAVI